MSLVNDALNQLPNKTSETQVLVNPLTPNPKNRRSISAIIFTLILTVIVIQLAILYSTGKLGSIISDLSENSNSIPPSANPYMTPELPTINELPIMVTDKQVQATQDTSSTTDMNVEVKVESLVIRQQTTSLPAISSKKESNIAPDTVRENNNHTDYQTEPNGKDIAAISEPIELEPDVNKIDHTHLTTANLGKSETKIIESKPLITSESESESESEFKVSNAENKVTNFEAEALQNKLKPADNRGSLSTKNSSIILIEETEFDETNIIQTVSDAMITNDFVQAETILIKALANQPDNISIRLVFARYWLQQENFEKALELLELQKSGEAIALRAMTFDLMDRPGKALNLYSELAKLNNLPVGHQLRYAVLLENAGNTSEARYWYLMLAQNQNSSDALRSFASERYYLLNGGG